MIGLWLDTCMRHPVTAKTDARQKGLDTIA